VSSLVDTHADTLTDHSSDILTNTSDISALDGRVTALETLTPTFQTVTLSNLTASKLIGLDGSNETVSIDLDDWIAGTADQVIVTDDTTGGITLSLPQSISVTSDVTFNSLSTTGINVGSDTISGADVIIKTTGGTGNIRIRDSTDANFVTFSDVSNQCVFGRSIYTESQVNFGDSTQGQCLSMYGTDVSTPAVVFKTPANGVMNFQNDTSVMLQLQGGALYSTSSYSNAVTGADLIVASNGEIGTATSVREAKMYINTLSSADSISVIEKLKPVNFKYRKYDKKAKKYTNIPHDKWSKGFIAEDVEKVDKNVCHYDMSGKLRGIKMNEFIAPLVAYVQLLKKEIISLQKRVQMLEKTR
jgi:hypothetical protein